MIALFAALSYAVTRSNRGSGGINNEDKILIHAAMDDIAAATSAGMSRLHLNQGCSFMDMSIDANPAGTWTNPTGSGYGISTAFNGGFCSIDVVPNYSCLAWNPAGGNVALNWVPNPTDPSWVGTQEGTVSLGHGVTSYIGFPIPWSPDAVDCSSPGPPPGSIVELSFYSDRTMGGFEIMWEICKDLNAKRGLVTPDNMFGAPQTAYWQSPSAMADAVCHGINTGVATDFLNFYYPLMRL